MRTPFTPAILLAAVLAGAASLAVAQTATGTSAGAPQKGASATEAATEAGEEGPPEFTQAYLEDPAHFETGKAVWEEQCRHCHGRSAYPGKAPRLKPRKYTPEFVFDRVTNGFRKMPAWGEVYSKEERMAVTAYILSKSFSP